MFQHVSSSLELNLYAKRGMTKGYTSRLEASLPRLETKCGTRDDLLSVRRIGIQVRYNIYIYTVPILLEINLHT